MGFFLPDLRNDSDLWRSVWHGSELSQFTYEFLLLLRRMLYCILCSVLCPWWMSDHMYISEKYHMEPKCYYSHPLRGRVLQGAGATAWLWCRSRTGREDMFVSSIEATGFFNFWFLYNVNLNNKTTLGNNIIQSSCHVTYRAWKNMKKTADMLLHCVQLQFTNTVCVPWRTEWRMTHH